MKWLTRLTLGLMAGVAAAQTNSASETGASTVTSAADQSAATDSSNSDLIQSLISGAESLLSSVYPSSSITQVASLTWPTAVVIGGSTYSVGSSSTAPSSFVTSSSISSSVTNSKLVQTSAAAEATSTVQPNHSGTNRADKRIAIVVGVVLGCVAFAVFGFLVWFLHRRNKRTGTFFRHRPSSPSESEIHEWRSPTSSTSQFPEKYANMSAPPPPMPLMTARHWSNGETTSPMDRSGSSSNPFYTPHESHAELAADSSRRNSIRSIHELRGDGPRQQSDNNRPPTPFSPAAMMAMASGPVSPISPSDEHQNHTFFRPQQQQQDYRAVFDQRPHDPRNPFAHEDDYDDEDDDDDNVFDTPPRIPTRSPKRNSSPVVHYPSGPELSTFDFGLDHDRRLGGSEEQINGGDGWRRPAHGPHELE
ncbi:hypothetical protein MBLNU459_g6885t1 [Dothideomycetes sp. NU459]